MHSDEPSAPNAGPAHVAEWLLLAGVCAALILGIFSGVVMSMPAGAACDALVIVLAGAHVAVGVGRGRLCAPRWQVLAGAGAFVVAGLISVFRAGNEYAAWGAFVHFVACVLLLVCVSGLASERSRARWLAAVLLATGVIASGFGIDDYCFGLEKTREMASSARAPELSKDVAVDLQGRLSDRRAHMPFDLPNTLAAFMVLVFPLALHGVLGGVRGSSAWAAAGVLGLALAAIVAALVLTFSKAGWLAFGLVLMAYSAWRALKIGRRAVTIAVALALVLIVVVGALGLIGALRVPGIQRYVWSASARMGYWRAGARIVESRPLLGVGLGNFAEHFFRYKPAEGEETRFAHNDYLQIAAETGLLGLAAFLVLLAAWAWCAAPRGDDADDGARPSFGLGLLAAAGGLGWLVLIGPAGALHPLLLAPILPCWLLVACSLWVRRAAWLSAAAFFGAVGVLAHCFVDFDLYARGLALPLWAMMGLALGSGGVRTYDVSRTRRRVALLLGVVAVMSVCWPRLIRRLSCESQLLKADAAVKAMDWPEYLERLIDAASAAPANPVPNARLGLLLQALGEHSKTKADRQDSFRRAATHLRNAIKLRPNWAAYRKWLADVCIAAADGDAARLAEALPPLRKAVELYPTQAHYRVALGRLYHRLGRGKEAIEQFRHALAIDDALDAHDGPAKLRLAHDERAAVVAMCAR